MAVTERRGGGSQWLVLLCSRGMNVANPSDCRHSQAADLVTYSAILHLCLQEGLIFLSEMGMTVHVQKPRCTVC